jgi:hypothetical protein
MILADRDCKEEVEEYIDALLLQIPSTENPTTVFDKPQQGGNKFKQNRIENIKNYLNKLEGKIHDNLLMYDDDSEISSPPIRRRQPNISYAQETKRLSFQSKSILSKNKLNQQTNSGLTMSTSMSTLTQSSLDDAITKLRDENTRAIENLRTKI